MSPVRGAIQLQRALQFLVCCCCCCSCAEGGWPSPEFRNTRPSSSTTATWREVQEVSAPLYTNYSDGGERVLGMEFTHRRATPFNWMDGCREYRVVVHCVWLWYSSCPVVVGAPSCYLWRTAEQPQNITLVGWVVGEMRAAVFALLLLLFVWTNFPSHLTCAPLCPNDESNPFSAISNDLIFCGH